MANGDDILQNCILEVCCGGDDRPARALARLIARSLPGPLTPETVAVWVLLHYDLAPKGTLYAFKQAIAALARGPQYEE